MEVAKRSTQCKGLAGGLACRWFVLLLAAVAGQAALAGQSVDRRFLDGLGERRLFRLAERYCRDRLAEPDLPLRRRAELVIGLSRSLAQRAVNSPPHERPDLWQQAQQIVDRFAQKHPHNPRLPLVELQGALALLARGELARQESRLVADNRLLVDEARSQLREAVRRLRELDEQVDARLHGLRLPGTAGRGQPDGLMRHELVSLAKNVRYQLARALRNQGQCYADDSPDQANSLTQAVRLLEPLAALDSTDPLAWKSRIDQVVCHRLLADHATARLRLDTLLKQKPPPRIALRGRAEGIRIALATNRLSDAIAAVALGRRIDHATSPDLDYARLETCLAAWRAAVEAKDPGGATRWQEKANDSVRLIEQSGGPYWARRAEMLLAGYVRASPGAGDLDTLVRAAESSYRSGRLDDALVAYDRARALAAKSGNADRAFELGYVAATIEHKRNRHEQALERYRQLALSMSDQAKASGAHLLAVHHAAELAKLQAPGSLDRYTSMLGEHIRQWPTGPGADRARQRLGRLRGHQRDWQNAIAAYRGVSSSDPQYAKAVEAAGRCYENWLAERKAVGESTDQIATEAADWLESLPVGPDKHPADRFSPMARQAALTAAKLRLDYTPAGYARAREILTAALKGAPDAPAEWRSAAEAMLVFSLAGSGSRREAGEVLQRISAGSPDQLLDLLDGLSRMATGAKPVVRSELAQLQLQAIELLRARADQLAVARRQQLDRIHAQALADAGRTAEALRQYESLSKRFPADDQLREAHARLLSGQSDRASLEAALGKWRKLEKRFPPATDRWFRAKYEVALLHYRLGNRKQAARIVTLLKVLHPELGGPAMKRQFDELLRRCEG